MSAKRSIKRARTQSRSQSQKAARSQKQTQSRMQSRSVQQQPSSKAPDQAVQKVRAPLSTRIALIIVAVFAVLGLACTTVNLYAVYLYNQATESLQTNLETAADDTADLQMLSLQQEQVDSQFDEAGAMSFTLLPQVREAIEQNAATSQELTERLAEELADQQSDSESDDSSSSTALDDENSTASGLTDEQRQQVEDLLESNQASTSSNSDADDDASSDDEKETSSVKPW